VRSILDVPRTLGNQAVQQMVQPDAGQPEVDSARSASPRFGHDFSRIPIYPPAAGAIQTKLAINEPGDSYEQEADRTAEHVMRTPAPQLPRARPRGGRYPTGPTAQPGRDHERVQTTRAPASDAGQTPAPPSVHDVVRSPGQPLDPATRAFMEPRFGYDFSRVRVHSGASAEQSAQDVNAHAYTVGHNMVFGAGRFAPGTLAGRRLIAHELTHVVQQSGVHASRVGGSEEGRGLEGLARPSGVRVQRGPSDPKSSAADVPILGGADPNPVVLYHYGNLEARRERDARTDPGAPFKSTRSYPRLTDCGTATCPAEVTQHTGTPQRETLRFKYELRINRAYFKKNFTEGEPRGAFFEYASKQPIPIKYFRIVSSIAPTTSAPSTLPTTTGAIIVPQRGSATPAGGGPSRAVTTTGGSIGLRGGGGGSGVGTVVGGLLTTAFVLAAPAIKSWFAENYLQEKWAAEERAMIEAAITRSTGTFNLLIASRMLDIQKEKMAGRRVILHVEVDTRSTVTDVGLAMTDADVSYHSLLFEGETGIQWPLFQSERGFLGTWMGAAQFVNRRETFDFVL
jgi:hypothetical protein